MRKAKKVVKKKIEDGKITKDDFLEKIFELDNLVDMAKVGLTCEDVAINTRSIALVYYAEIFQMAISELYEKQVLEENNLYKQFPLTD